MHKIKSLHRTDLLKLFPDYKYDEPNEPWKLNYQRADNITGHQLAAFHFRWACNMGADSAKPGLSINIAGVPYCLCVADKSEKGVHLVTPSENLINLFQPQSFPLIIISSAISLLRCGRVTANATPEEKMRRWCPGDEIIPVLREWATLLIPDGVMVAVIVDEAYAREAGWSLFEKGEFQHVWTAKRFEEYIVGGLYDLFDLEEFNNMGNRFAFNCVLRRK